MKTLLSILLLFLTTNVFSQGYKERTVLKNFMLYYDSEKTIKNKTNFNELNSYDYGLNDNVIKITIDEYMYKQQACKIVLLLVNNDLYAVKYIPKNEKRCLKYEKILNTEYNIEEQNNSSHWFNSSIEIYLEEDGNGEKSFIHYDIELVKKYPQYKNIL
jgi:hypothetical protein